MTLLEAAKSVIETAAGIALKPALKAAIEQLAIAAAELHEARSTAAKSRKRSGVRPRVDRALVRSLRAAGKSPEEIAAVANCSPLHVYKILREPDSENKE
jgi:DNA invertase Pin-like site-specific DNA recombinase